MRADNNSYGPRRTRQMAEGETLPTKPNRGVTLDAPQPGGMTVGPPARKGVTAEVSQPGGMTMGRGAGLPSGRKLSAGQGLSRGLSATAPTSGGMTMGRGGVPTRGAKPQPGLGRMTKTTGFKPLPKTLPKPRGTGRGRPVLPGSRKK